MRANVFMSAVEVEPAAIQGRDVAVIDVIRATSTIVEALANGASAIFPTRSTEDALRLAGSLGREDTLLCGERKGLKIEGFDLGNSPLEFTRDRVADRQLVMSTTNGTQAFAAATGARRIVAAALLNLRAVAGALRGTDDLVILCAGKEGAFSLDDALTAGLLLKEIVRDEPDVACNDGAMAVLALAEQFDPTAALLAQTAAGKALLEIGMVQDLEACARRDLYEVVPEMHDRTIRPAKAVAS